MASLKQLETFIETTLKQLDSEALVALLDKCAGRGQTWVDVLGAIRNNDVGGSHLAAVVDDPARVVDFFRDELGVTITGFVAKQLVPRLYDAYQHATCANGVGIAPIGAATDALAGATTTALPAALPARTTAPTARTTAPTAPTARTTAPTAPTGAPTAPTGAPIDATASPSAALLAALMVQTTAPKGATSNKCQESNYEQTHSSVTSYDVRREINWNRMFELLVEFKQKNGHMFVPVYVDGAHNALGEWVKTQRKKLINVQRGKAASNPTFEEHVRKLTEIGFDWTRTRGRNRCQWSNMFTLLVEFKKQYGHTRVPLRTKLGNWVSRQRNRLQKASPLDERICRLNELGFEWKCRQGRPAHSATAASNTSGLSAKRKVDSTTISSSSSSSLSSVHLVASGGAQSSATEDVDESEQLEAVATTKTKGPAAKRGKRGKLSDRNPAKSHDMAICSSTAATAASNTPIEVERNADSAAVSSSLHFVASGGAQSSSALPVVDNCSASQQSKQLETAKCSASKQSKLNKHGSPARSLRELIDSGYVNPGPKALKMTYCGQTFFADLDEGGAMFEHGKPKIGKPKIYWYPSNFTLAMKRKVRPGFVKDSKSWRTLLYCCDGTEMPLIDIWNRYVGDSDGVLDGDDYKGDACLDSGP